MAEFWRHKSLEEMNAEEWESLCDGCARCCLIKLSDPESDEVSYTAAHCEFLDASRCRCTDYERRTQLVDDCVRLTPRLVREANWLPHTCAYRLIAEGKELPVWHPLRTGDANSVFEAGIAIRGRTVSATSVHQNDLDDMVVTWVHPA